MLTLRHKNLVYIPITKCASTTYIKFFQECLGWESIDSDTIDWENDHVFSHIIHPAERHLKGTATALLNLGISDLIDHPQFSKLFATAVFDLHSYPYTATFGLEHAYKIDWLPLDHHSVSGNRFTKKFLQDNGVNTEGIDIPSLNVSHPGSKKLVEKLRNLRGTPDQDQFKNGMVSYFYENDLVLYYRVMTKLTVWQIDNWSWDKCSWLADKENNV